MWTDATREKYEREAHRYASDLSDTEWCVIEPHMPPARALGRPRKTDMREVMNAILYMARSGWLLRTTKKVSNLDQTT